MEIHTVGFTRRSAEDFFSVLRAAGIRRLIDTRLHNTSQLAAFAKRDDLAYFLRELVDASYQHEPLLAPGSNLLDDYKKKRIDWDTYARRYLDLLEERDVAAILDPALIADRSVLLCS